MTKLAEVADRHWDVLIVGSGMGGGTLARQMIRDGFSVLLVERGSRIRECPPGDNQPPMQRGFWPEPLTVETAHGDAYVSAPLGCAVGGSTIHYAAALERLAPSDFQPLQLANGETVAWPVSWAEFQTYYERAEQLFGVAGPEAGWERLSPWDRELASTLGANGLCPQVLKVAMRYDDGCKECVGRICPRRCKADVAVTCIDHIAQDPRFRLLENCEALRVESSSHEVEGVLVEQAGVRRLLTASVVVLAAGALHTPRLLLRSHNKHWPAGLANSSGLVGRNLMFHTVDFLALWSRRRLSREGRQQKALSIRDLYEVGGQRLGYVQSLGMEAGRGEVAAWMKNLLSLAGLRSAFLQKLLAGIASRIAVKWLGKAGLFVLSAEDDPDPSNRVMFDESRPDAIRVRYEMPAELHGRARRLRARVRESIRPWLAFSLLPAALPNYGHACGTCRSGTDPASSVLDPDCRAHGIDNLFVVDASFFPRSGAANPSLTIAANALRVAEAITLQLQLQSRQEEEWANSGTFRDATWG